MSFAGTETEREIGNSSSKKLIPVAVLWGATLVAGLGFLWLQDGFNAGLGEFYLIPWAILAGIVILAPSIIIYFGGKMDVFHPLVFGVWTYIFPAFVLGAVILAFGWSDPYYLTFVENPQYNLPLSLFYVVLGYVSIVAGFYFPLNKFFVLRLERILPDWEWCPEEVLFPGILLMAFGIGFNILGFVQGLLGFQRIDEFGLFDGLLFFLTIIYTIGNLLLWLAIFQTKSRNSLFYILVGLLILMIPMKMALQGSRGSLMLSVLPVAMAFWYSGRRLKWQHTVAFAGVLFLAVSIGIVYGTSFRNIKGSEARTEAGDYLGQISETVDYISRTDTTKLVESSMMTLFERIENLSSLGVVVANYEKLESYEESYGLKNNIYNDLVTSFVPRFVWPDKPSTSDARAYSDLYFSYGENSFAITPFGDLLRNFGVIGIPLGMFIIGIYFKIIYSTLIDTATPQIWKKMAYFPLLTVVSYEAFYATVFPSMIRVLVVLFACLLFVRFLTPKTNIRQSV